MVRIIVPLAIIVGVLLLTSGVIANISGAQEVSMLAGGQQTILGGPVAAWKPIKLMSGDGGGAFNVNSAHPSTAHGRQRKGDMFSRKPHEKRWRNVE